MHLLMTALVIAWTGASAPAEELTLPSNRRPAWLARDGIVMAGSWEPLLFRVRRDGATGYAPTPEQQAAYGREHSLEMIDQLKSLGVNFVMMHAYKGFGLKAEAESMRDAVNFSRLCRDAGLRVGVYNNSGTLGWELFFAEVPQAKGWLVQDSAGRPRIYGRADYRYYWNRNHPEAQAFHRQLVRFSIEQVQADLLHFDNYNVGPGAEPHSAARFREYLRTTFSPEQRERLGIADLDRVHAPITGPPDNILRRAWLDFACQSLADSYHDMGRYARTLKSEILLECNPGGPGLRIEPPVDHGRLLTGGEASWDEGEPAGFRDGRLITRIRTYKVARRMNNTAFAYATTPLEAAESMAFNQDSLGCIAWFEYGRLVAMPGSTEPVSRSLEPLVRFFRDRRDLFRETKVVADVAVLRSFPSQVFSDRRNAELTAAAEQALIEARVPFQIIYDRQVPDLHQYRCLVLAGCVALSNEQLGQIREFVIRGGRLCLAGPCATHDEWFFARDGRPFEGLPDDRVVRVDASGEVVGAVRRICGGLSLTVDGPLGLCAELTEQEGRRLVHLLDYRPAGHLDEVPVSVAVPPGKVVRNVIVADPWERREELAFQQAGQKVTFKVPDTRLYTLIAVSW